MRLILPKTGIYNKTSLKGYWNFDSDYEDQIGSNDLTASATGVTRSTSRSEFSNAAVFSGGYLYNSSMSSVPSGDNDITLNCWVYLANVLSPQNIIIYNGTSATSGGIGFRLSITGLEGVADNTGYDLGATGNLATQGAWMMLTATYDASASEVKFYYNGILADTQTITDRNFQGELFISGFSDSDMTVLGNGAKVDEVSIFNEPLTIEEIRQLYSQPGLGGQLIETDTVVMYNFENDYLDDCYLYHNGQQSAAGVALTEGEGRHGNCALTLSGGYVSASAAADILTNEMNVDTNDFTIEAWIYYSAGADATPGIASKLDAVSGNGWTFCMTQSNMKLRCIMYKNLGEVYAIAGTNSFSADAWHYVVMTREGTTIKFYIDGALDKTDTRADNAVGYGAPNADFIVGYNAYNDHYFNGKIDNIRFLNGTALTQKQIQKRYTQGLGWLNCN